MSIDRLNATGVRVEYAAPGVHEKKAEAAVKQMRCRFPAVRNQIAYNLPSVLYSRLLTDVANTLNIIPTLRSNLILLIISLGVGKCPGRLI